MTGETSSHVHRAVTSKNRLTKIKKRLPKGFQFFEKIFHTGTDNKSNEPDGPLDETMVTRRSSSTRSVREVLLTFRQNIEQQRFAAAGEHLISREERLFALNQDGMGSSRRLVEEENNEEESLKRDFEDLIQQVWSVVNDSLNCKTAEKEEVLKQAVLVIEQEEEQDRRWEGFEVTERPPWRPRCLRQSHNFQLQKMVLQRMEEAQLDTNTTMPAVQREITAKGKQLKYDLLTVAEHVRNCYPGENVCQLYASLYHQAFSDKLKEITEYGLGNEDSIHVLLWVNQLYPGILKGGLGEFIEYEQLEALLPDSTIKTLEDQVLFHKENELQRWTSNALRMDKNCNPDLKDDYYFSTLAIDVITFIHGVLTSLEEVLGSKTKTLGIAESIKTFLYSYKQFIEECIGDDQINTDAVFKANLHCIRQLRDYIKKNDYFPAHIKTEFFSLLTSIRDICHGYFIKPIHKDLKRKYSKLGTPEWQKHNEHVCHDLLDGLEGHIKNLKNLETSCLEELVGHLHEDVLVEYVRKMMKKKIKLGDEKKQHHAHKALCENSQKIHNLFTMAGSRMDWLKEILPALAELLILTDPHCIELQLVTLSRTYPGFSEAHMSAWLYLKGNLSTSELKKIKKAFVDFQDPADFQDLEILEITTGDEDQDPDHSHRNFFSKVIIK